LGERIKVEYKKHDWEVARFIGLKIGKRWVRTLCTLKMREIFGLNEQLLKASQ